MIIKCKKNDHCMKVGGVQNVLIKRYQLSIPFNASIVILETEETKTQFFKLKA